MTTLTKLQLALLTGAYERPDGSLLPAPEGLSVAPNRARKAAGQVIELGLADEREIADQTAAWRTDGGTTLGAFVTEAGRAKVAPAESEPAPHSLARVTKTDLLLELLSRTNGTSLDELVAATGWLPHTARAALTMLKKKGHAVERSGNRGQSRYRIAGVA